MNFERNCHEKVNSLLIFINDLVIWSRRSQAHSIQTTSSRLFPTGPLLVFPRRGTFLSLRWWFLIDFLISKRLEPATGRRYIMGVCHGCPFQHSQLTRPHKTSPRHFDSTFKLLQVQPRMTNIWQHEHIKSTSPETSLAGQTDRLN